MGAIYWVYAFDTTDIVYLLLVVAPFPYVIKLDSMVVEFAQFSLSKNSVSFPRPNVQYNIYV